MLERRPALSRTMTVSRLSAYWDLYRFFRPNEWTGPVLENLDGHLAYQIKLQNDGVMFAAGSLASEDGAEFLGHGIFVYHAKSMEHAFQIAASDPMHMAGARRFRVLPWLLNEGDLRL
jgi:uncharacterized protein